jgi:hypothetical protein
MADEKTKTEAKPERTEVAIVPAKVPAAARAVVAAARPARVASGSAPKRASKGQRKHLRRQKQAGEVRGNYHR